MVESNIHQRKRVDPGYKRIPIGTETHPFLIQRPEYHGGTIDFAWRKISSNTQPLYITSNRDYDEAIATLMRNLPVRGMIGALVKVFQNPLVNITSDPGYGKTFLAHMVGNVMNKEGVVEYIAAGRSMQNLIYETVFDSRRNKDFAERIDQALAEGSLNDLSLAELRKLNSCGGVNNIAVYIENLEKQDWEALAKADFDVEKFKGNIDELRKLLEELRKLQVDIGAGRSLLIEEGDTKRFDWKGLEKSGIDTAEIARAFDAVKRYQEWNGSMNVGFEDRPGKLWEAALTGRPLLIDEAPRRIPGTEGPMTVIWQVLSGERSECEVHMGNLGSFVIRHGDIPTTMLTSNRLKDGEDVHPFSDSLNSRLVNVEVGKFSESDWQDRFEQLLTGISITTLSLLEIGNEDKNKKWWVSSPKNLEENLHALRKSDPKPIPHLQQVYLKNWRVVQEVSERLAQAYFAIEELLDPESKLMQGGTINTIKFEVTRPGDPVKPLTPRTPQHQIMGIAHVGYSVSDIGKGTEPNFRDLTAPSLRPPTETPEENFGSRLKQAILEWIVDVCGKTPDSTARPALLEQMLRILNEAQILSDNSILEKLDVKKVEIVKPVASKEVVDAAAMINFVLKQKYPEADDIPAEEIEVFLGTVKNTSEEVTADQFTWVTLPEDLTDGLKAEQVGALIELDDTDPVEFGKDNSPSTMITEQRLLTSLVLPHIGNRAIKSLFFHRESPSDQNDLAGKASIYEHEKLAITTVICQDNVTKGNCAIHFVVNKESGEMLAIKLNSQPAPEELAERLMSHGITYVSQDRVSQDIIERWINRNFNRDEQDILKEAFQVRNGVEESNSEDTLIDMLSKKGLSYPDSITVMSALKQGRQI